MLLDRSGSILSCRVCAESTEQDGLGLECRGGPETFFYAARKVQQQRRQEGGGSLQLGSVV